MKETKRWIYEYIDNLDIRNIEWIKLNNDELETFLKENYYDKSVYKYVCDDFTSGMYPKFLGMNYLNIYTSNNGIKESFLLGIVDNNIGKKTIIGDFIYCENYILFDNQEIPLTYIHTAEVNRYYRGNGIYRQMCLALYDFIYPNQHIITTLESEMGEICHAFKIFEDSLRERGFNKRIFKDINMYDYEELYDEVVPKIKKLNIN